MNKNTIIHDHINSVEAIASNSMLSGVPDIGCSESINNLTELLNLFVLIESTVLYERIGFFATDTEHLEQDVSLTEFNKELIKNNVLLPRNLINDINKSRMETTRKAYVDILNFHKIEMKDEKIRERLSHDIAADSISLAATNALRTGILENPAKYEKYRKYINWLSRDLVKALFVSSMGVEYCMSPLEQPTVEIPIIKTNRSLAKQIYQLLEDKLKGEVISLQDLGAPIPMVIPPIIALVLDRAGTSSKIISETLALRDEFAPFRNKYISYQQTIRNPDGKNLNELIVAREEAISEVFIALDKIPKKHSDSRLISELFSSSLTSNEDNVNLKSSLSLSGLIKIGINKVRLEKIKGRARSLFDLWKKVVDIKDYHMLVQRVFSLDIEKDEIVRYQKYCEDIESLYSIQR